MRIDYHRDLNPRQLEAVTAVEGPVMVIAGAGSGKTRTIVYRLARLIESGVDPTSILLLTFTRKAAGEMLARAGQLLDMGLGGVLGGTFHGFAYSVLRQHTAEAGFPDGFTILDRSDSEDLVAQARQELGVAKGEKTFPKKGTVMQLVSKARNKEVELERLILAEAFHLREYTEDLERIAERYDRLKTKYGAMDYDDLLVRLDVLLRDAERVRNHMAGRFSHVMVDEYQDTNLIQARLIRRLGGENGNVMAVGDDAQSIYAFRGANVRNIYDFQEHFPGARIIKLEQNYRSTQPILELTNAILAQAREGIPKRLFTDRPGSECPEIVRTVSDLTQAGMVKARIDELSVRYPLHEIAVLFRAGYQSFPLEMALNKSGVRYQKYGGARFTDSAHIKDILAFMRLVLNPMDLPALKRAMAGVQGVGPKTCERICEACSASDTVWLAGQRARNAGLDAVLGMLEGLRSTDHTPAQILDAVMEYYGPIMEVRFVDDYPRRKAGVDQLAQIVAGYMELDAFLADISLEAPESLGRSEHAEDHVVLSTVHSAKGLEWSAVIVIDLVEERFPSRHAMNGGEEFEEERRLLYVACTRARESLTLFMPETLFNRYTGSSLPAAPSPFIDTLPPGLAVECRESRTGGLLREAVRPDSVRDSIPAPGPSATPTKAPIPGTGFCTHKIFGRGKIVAVVPPNKFKVNFIGFGLKTILADYLEVE
ncbi:MAG: ATP-dependent helicase [Deltaproteobacteria bacterium]|nr:ATP-dependent helicase [Deltaproteobacteria bacterium]